MNAPTAVTGPARAGVPTIAHTQVWHVGSLNPADKGRAGPSYEGDGLSVSNCPDRWVRIARLGGQLWWRRRRHDSTPGAFLDAHAAVQAIGPDAAAWGASHGLAEVRTVYAAHEIDCETGDKTTTWLASHDQALDLTDGDDDAIEQRDELLATELLLERCGWNPERLTGALDLLWPMWAEAETDLDGVWWNDQPGHLAAPRGVIVPTRLHRWDRQLDREPA